MSKAMEERIAEHRQKIRDLEAEVQALWYKDEYKDAVTFSPEWEKYKEEKAKLEKQIHREKQFMNLLLGGILP